LRYLSDVPAVRETLLAFPQAKVIFNYLGQFDQSLPEGALFAPLREPIGPARDPRGRRAHSIAVNGRVLGGRLVLEWSFGGGLYRRETIERLAKGFIERTRELLAHCLSPEAGGHTPSDFPLARVGQEDLDRVFDEVELGE
jgi:non-ribosomal peptide synthase protein (TIGR01720 family)